jgi:hypothetical protein
MVEAEVAMLVTVVPAKEDKREDELLGLEQSFKSQGLDISFRREDLYAPSIPGMKRLNGGFLGVEVLGDFVVKAVAIVGPPVGTVLGAWLHARYGRKVRLKIGDIEAEAQTAEEVERLLARAQEFQQHTQPNVIHEP